jgi:glycosyltransferase involved in cell wall biosynthesis
MAIKAAPAIVSFSDPSAWHSCQTIAANLAKANRHAFKSACNIFTLGRKLDPSEIKSMVAAIKWSRPERVIFVDDYFPHPEPVILAMKEAFRLEMPPIYIHLYGDFSLVSAKWLALEKNILGEKFMFLGASAKQTAFVDSFFANKGQSTHHCPFPVNASDYFFNPELRAKERQRLGLTGDDRLIVYTGRMTYQKNVLRLLSEFRRFAARDRRRTFLFLAGFFDDAAGPFNHLETIPGMFFQQFQALVEKMPNRTARRLRFLGHLNAKELNALYNAADAFASLSTFHDEDFGMAPAEALMTGTPAMLTDWAGYSSFRINQDCVHFVPVEIDKSGLYLESSKIQQSLRQILCTRDKAELRLRRSEQFRNVFSIEGVASQIIDLHRKPVPPFGGFNRKMQKLAERVGIMSRPAFPVGSGRGSLYHTLYRPYMDSL